MQRFQCSTKLFYGDHALDTLKDLTAQRILIVTDPFFEQNGLAQEIGRRTQASSVSLFSGITADPTLEQVAAGARQMQAVQPEALIALGGGSPIDCAKAMLLTQPERPFFVAIPTTSGTGSEMTSFAIVTHGGVKHPLIDPALLPDWAILDDALLQSLPPQLVAVAGFDILAHCLEALASRRAEIFSDALATEGFRRTLTLLPRSFAGDTAVRAELHACATMAGLAFEHAGLGLCHAMSHALGGLTHLPHGQLNAILLPAILRFNAPAVRARYADLARVCGLGGASEQLAFHALLRALIQLRTTLRLPASLPDAALVTAHMDGLAEAALHDACSRDNPVAATHDDICRLLREVL